MNQSSSSLNVKNKKLFEYKKSTAYAANVEAAKKIREQMNKSKPQYGSF